VDKKQKRKSIPNHTPAKYNTTTKSSISRSKKKKVHGIKAIGGGNRGHKKKKTQISRGWNHHEIIKREKITIKNAVLVAHVHWELGWGLTIKRGPKKDLPNGKGGGVPGGERKHSQKKIVNKTE